MWIYKKKSNIAISRRLKQEQRDKSSLAWIVAHEGSRLISAQLTQTITGSILMVVGVNHKTAQLSCLAPGDGEGHRFWVL